MMRRRKPSTSSSMFGVFLLMLIVLVTVAGIGTAVYLQGSGELAQTVHIAQDTTTAARDSLPLPLPELSSPLPPEREAPPPPPEPPAATTAMPAIEPAAGSPSNDPPVAVPTVEPSPATPSEPQQTAALEAPAASSPSPEASPAKVEDRLESDLKNGFWIEYGVYAGRRYAERLQRSLSAIGLDAEITATHTPKGRSLLRVRSPVIADRAAARAMAKKAEHALGIAALLHTTTTATPPAAMVARSTRSNGPYWVQFGAFTHSAPAKRLQGALKRGGVATIVSKVARIHHKSLFLVRAVKVESLHAALTLAERGNEVMRIAHWVGQSRADHHHRATHKHAGRPAPPRAMRGNS